MDKILNALTEFLPYSVEENIRWRVDAMIRDLDYLEGQESDNILDFLEKNDWSRERIEVVFVLNAFFQQVLSPLTSAVRTGDKSKLVDEIPITYGDDLVVDQEYSRGIRTATKQFHSILEEMGIPEACVTANHAEDVFESLPRGRD